MNLDAFLNKKVLIRCYGAGVHFGTLLEKEGKEIRLGNARRLWNWNGALSLHEVASIGIDIKNSKISEPVKQIILPEHIEMLPLTSNLASL